MEPLGYQNTASLVDAPNGPRGSLVLSCGSAAPLCGKAPPFRLTNLRQGCALPARRSLAEEGWTFRKGVAVPHKGAAEPHANPPTRIQVDQLQAFIRRLLWSHPAAIMETWYEHCGE